MQPLLVDYSQKESARNMDEDQMRAATLVERGENVFLTGAAGTGKSWLLKEIIRLVRSKMPSRKLYVTSSTGKSALHIGGTTLFKAFGFPKVGAAFKCPDRCQGDITLILDEISMITIQLLEHLDALLRHHRKIKKPMGGIQVVFVGDFLQLPPVDRKRPPGVSPDYCFESKVWKDLNLRVVELTMVYRQEDMAFIQMLHRIRKGEPSSGDSTKLRSMYEKQSNGEIQPSILFCKVAEVDGFNSRELKKLEGKVHKFAAYATAKKGRVSDKQLKEAVGNLSVPNPVELKVGAQVSLATNYLKIGLGNGSRGVVIDFEDSWPVVRFATKIVKIRPYQWEVALPGNKVVVVTAIPLQLAWAMTIHKSQGSSIDYVHVNMSGAFAYGQVYVGLSRATSRQGLSVEGFNPKNVKACPKALAFYNTFVTPESKRIKQEFHACSAEEEDESSDSSDSSGSEEDSDEDSEETHHKTKRSLEPNSDLDSDEDAPQRKRLRKCKIDEDEDEGDEDEEEKRWPKNPFINDAAGDAD